MFVCPNTRLTLSMGIPFESANASRGARHAVTHFPKIDFDQNDHDHFDHHVTAGESTWAL